MTGKRPERRSFRRYDPLAVLWYIASYQQSNHHHSPSQRRIQADLGISAPSVVHMIVKRLERAALLMITRHGRGNRVDLTLTEAGQQAVQRWQAERANEAG